MEINYYVSTNSILTIMTLHVFTYSLVLIYHLIQYMNRLRSAQALIPVSAQARCKPYVNTSS